MHIVYTMPSGTYKDECRECKICGKKLRPLYKNEDWKARKYHVSCFRDIMADIANYRKIAYTKYGHKKKVAGMFVEDIKPDTVFTINWD